MNFNNICMKLLSSFVTCGLWLMVSPLGAQSPATKLLPFQGRLTDASGKPISDGVRLIQFQIYSEPSGGSVLWAGELHRTTINGGLVNVVLGSKNPLPNDRLDQPDKSFFDQPLYLQITSDANADNQITAADPPLLPRQSILPVVFAQESANARKLAGYDWSALFGTNNPVDGKLPGSRISPGSVTTAQIGNAAITGAQLASNSVSTVNLANGAITASKLAPDAVSPTQLQDASVTQPKLALRSIGTNVPAGGVAISLSSGIFTSNLTTSTTPVNVPNLSVTMMTTGRPVCLGLISDGTLGTSVSGTGSAISVAGPSTYGGGEVECIFVRGTNVISSNRLIVSQGQAITTGIHLPCSAVQFLDTPPAGTHNYRFQIRSLNGHTVTVYRVKLIAYEL